MILAALFRIRRASKRLIGVWPLHIAQGGIASRTSRAFIVNMATTLALSASIGLM
jgi:hypothetical protein